MNQNSNVKNFKSPFHALQQFQGLKLSQNKKDLTDITAAPFLVLFFLMLAAEKKTPKTGQL
jgi:hypothetical protein